MVDGWCSLLFFNVETMIRKPHNLSCFCLQFGKRYSGQDRFFARELRKLREAVRHEK